MGKGQFCEKHLKMKYVAAYCLGVMGGNESPSASDLKKVLGAVDAEFDSSKADSVVAALKGRSLSDVIADGLGKMSSMSFGGGSGGARAGPADTGNAGPAPAEVKEEEPEEEEEDMDLGDLFG